MPPAFGITYVKSGEEVRWKGVNGDRVEWYEAKPYDASFLLWGFDRRSVNRNIPFGDLRAYLRAQGWDVTQETPD